MNDSAAASLSITSITDGLHRAVIEEPGCGAIGNGFDAFLELRYMR